MPYVIFGTVETSSSRNSNHFNFQLPSSVRNDDEAKKVASLFDKTKNNWVVVSYVLKNGDRIVEKYSID